MILLIILIYYKKNSKRYNNHFDIGDINIDNIEENLYSSLYLDNVLYNDNLPRINTITTPSNDVFFFKIKIDYASHE